MSFAYSSSESFFGSTIPFLVPLKSGFFSGFNRPHTISATLIPIAGALVSPGDSIPAASTKKGASLSSSIINSWLSSWARLPEKDVITWRTGTLGTLLVAAWHTWARPCAVVLVDSGSSWSSAVGPIKVFP